MSHYFRNIFAPAKVREAALFLPDKLEDQLSNDCSTGLANDRNWPILLKKSTMVSTAEKYALEIEI
ncbi:MULTISPECIES: hypothetical protein [Pseudomonas]|uniref:Uncharacterized protein n=1 Tax=Pseudomonas reinekei TaxID=395598 RepID=A0A1Q9WUY7_PSERE|nr:hypothetical protein [Pseudomonas reinekei]KAB0485740.1 hypothetical protein F7R15_12185 [Pseudomonas reinekei]OLU02592.1 hypothetical protein BVK86_14045 [Pseudomonas reinekei]